MKNKVKYYPIGVSSDFVLFYNSEYSLNGEELNGYVVTRNTADPVDLMAFLLRSNDIRKVPSGLADYVFTMRESFAIENKPAPDNLIPKTVKPIPLFDSSEFMEETLTKLNIPFASLSPQ